MFGYIRVTSVVPDVAVADVEKNTEYILNKMEELKDSKTDILVFPELSITGYSCGDLFFQSTLTESALNSIKEIAKASEKYGFVTIVGAPVKYRNSLYNCAVVIGEGKVLGIVPKTFLPDYNEFYEKRWFASLLDFPEPYIDGREIGLSEDYIPAGNIIFNMNGLTFGVEVCEDLWAPVSPAQFLAIEGAEVIINISAGNELINKRAFRREMIKQQSARLSCAYVYVSAGCNESVSDIIFSGHSITALNGKVVAENKDYIASGYAMTCDFDIEKIRADRTRIRTFKDAQTAYEKNNIIFQDIMSDKQFLSDGSLSDFKREPFIPSNETVRRERCYDVFRMQAMALKRRLDITGGKAVIGVSGGLDSTLALLVSAEAMKLADRPSGNVTGITMPCFGTTDRTYNNAMSLMKALGVDIKEIPIKDACIQHFKDIGQDINNHDITYENAQARERTQVLMDIANKNGAIVVGTGDLSELALGWCTYNGDHMSMYGVNCGVPKTLLKWMIESLIANNVFPNCNEILKDILDTPISPELLPPDENGEIKQKTEDVVGPYILHDFFLYYMIRFGFSPSKIYFLAKNAFKGEYDDETILKWLKTFYKRFFTQQFKRNCIPDGVKIGSVSLSPRGDWRMPSDAASKIWSQELETLK